VIWGEILTFGGLALLAFFGGLIGGFLAQLVKSTLDAYKLAQLERRVERLENTLKSANAVGTREARADRMGAAIAEAATMFGQGKKPDEILKELVPKYPDVGLELIKKGFHGKLGGLV